MHDGKNYTVWWNGWNDRDTEDHWVSQDAKQLNQSNIQSWAKNEPNDHGGKEDCAISVKHDTFNQNGVDWVDVPCYKNFPALCEVPMKEVFTLRGTFNF